MRYLGTCVLLSVILSGCNGAELRECREVLPLCSKLAKDCTQVMKECYPPDEDESGGEGEKYLNKHFGPKPFKTL